MGVEVFMLSPSNGSWVFSVPYWSGGYCRIGPMMETSGLAIDPAGNMYLALANLCNSYPSTCNGHGDSAFGAVIMQPAGGNVSDDWYRPRIQFTPAGPLAVCASGNVYGTTGDCGQYGYGTVWKVTPQ